MTPQEIFDTALKGVVAQGGRSMKQSRAGFCAYRGSDGRKCGVGHLIDDDTAQHWDTCRDTSIRYIAEFIGLPEPLVGHTTLLEQIQFAHDHSGETGTQNEIHNFIEAMREVAEEHGLVFTDPRTELIQ